ncbi:tetratricopeptide repeat protein [Hydrogenobaculum acidophilum]
MSMLYNIFFVLSVYIILSFICAALFVLLAPKRFDKKVIDILMLFLLNLTLGPIFSILSLILAIALNMQKPLPDFAKVKANVKDWEIEKRPVGEKALSGTNVPTSALYAILNNKDVRFVRAIKSVLSSENDENRLLAFGYLQRIEKEYFDTLKRLEDIYNKSQNIIIMKKIAITIWEMLLFDIVEDDLRPLYHQRCKEILLDLSSKLDNDWIIFYILGRIYLIEKKYEDAFLCFEKALDLAVDKSRVMPYLFEALFYQKRFKDIKKYCEKYKDDKIISVNIVSNNIISFWCK